MCSDNQNFCFKRQSINYFIINKINTFKIKLTLSSLFMKKSKTCKEREEKDFDQCINFQKCKGKWYRYRNKADNGYCKACIKTEN